MRVVYIGAGAGGMYCGSCLRDNALAKALIDQGRDVVLVPAYTPMRTDEPSCAHERVVFGALNVYLRHLSRAYRHAPAAIQRLLDRPSLIRLASRFSGAPRADSLSALAFSTLQGCDGPTRDEIVKLACWIAGELKPDVVNLPNAMLAGLAREVREQTGAPVLCTLSGEDSYIEAMSPVWKERCKAEMRRQAAHCDGFIATSRYYAEHMADYLEVPRARIQVAPLGIDLTDHGNPGARRREPFTIAFLARICPDKGLRELIEAFIEFKKMPEGEGALLRAAGYLDAKEKSYLKQALAIAEAAGMGRDVEYVGELTRAEKVRFLHEAGALCVPSRHPEPKGLFALEALANGVPVVLPRRGSFVELVEESGGGLLVEPDDPAALARGFAAMRRDPDGADAMGRAGMEWVRTRRSAARMAEATWTIYERHLTTREGKEAKHEQDVQV